MSLFNAPEASEGGSQSSKLGPILLVAALALGLGTYYYLQSATPTPDEPPIAAVDPNPVSPEPSPDPAPKRDLPRGPSTGSLSIGSNVDDASVYVEGELRGSAPLDLSDLEPGTYQIRVTKDGYEPHESSVRIRAGKTTYWTADLARPPASLVVTSDVPGATVFLDRNYVGTTPATATELSPGSHQVTVSADGYDIYAETVEVASGKKEIHVAFKQASLNESVSVVHKHRMGSCEGTLHGTASGLRYDTSNEKDRFSVSFVQLERFEVDYIEKNLKVKPKGSRNFNFTEKTGNSDPLYVFHQKVQAFRDKSDE